MSPTFRVATDACWALSYITNGPNDRLAPVLEAGICPLLIELLRLVPFLASRMPHQPYTP